MITVPNSDKWCSSRVFAWTHFSTAFLLITGHEPSFSPFHSFLLMIKNISNCKKNTGVKTKLESKAKFDGSKKMDIDIQKGQKILFTGKKVIQFIESQNSELSESEQPRDSCVD